MEGRDAVSAAGGGATLTPITAGADKFVTLLQPRVVSTTGTNAPPLHVPTPLRTFPPTTTAMTLSSPVSDGSGPAAHNINMNMSTSTQSAAFSGLGGSSLLRSEPVKRKRGRPRKYSGSDSGGVGPMALALTPLAIKTPLSRTEKRGRGRPPGSGKKQQLAALGSWIAGSGGQGFTPHVITIAAGEDVAHKVYGFSQNSPRAVCVLSANGSISNVTLRHDSSFGGSITYEGRYEILSLTGSFLPADVGGLRSRTGGLSVSLAANDGKVVGGSVSGLLVAATPVQIVIGSFVPEGAVKPRPPQVGGTPPGNGEQIMGMMTSIGLAPSMANSGVTMAATIPATRAFKNESSTMKASNAGSCPSSVSSLNHQSGIPSTSAAPAPATNSGPFQSSGWHSPLADAGRRSPTDINISLPGG